MFVRPTPNPQMSLPPNFGVPAFALAAERNGFRNPVDIQNILFNTPPSALQPLSHPGMLPMTPRAAPPLPSMQQTPASLAFDSSRKDPAPPPPQMLPPLDDVIAFYISQGRLFKCQYCNILFFERGMFFLHASLHGNSSPWECSICHKICSDKNEFTLHFVNQQHAT